MPFEKQLNSIKISRCSEECVLNEVMENDFENITFAGFSKGHNLGIKFNNNFYVERLAKDWDGKKHDFGVTIIREQVVKSGIILKKLKDLNYTNLLRIKEICDCTVVVEFIEGYLFNSKKEKWYLGPLSYSEDYLDKCNIEEMISVFIKIGQVILGLHENGICHTDPADHNIMISKKNDEPILIDLIGSMPYTRKLERLDCYVYLKHFVIPSFKRKKLKVPKMVFSCDMNDESLRELIQYFYEYKAKTNYYK